MKKTLFVPLAALFIASACNNSNDVKTSQPPEDTATAISEEDPQGAELEAIQTAFPELYGDFSKADPSFSIDSFYLADSGPVDTYDQQALEAERIDPFLPYLIYNADSSKAIDMVSYNYEPIQRNGKMRFTEAGPDVEVALVDLVKKTRQRILFLGTNAGLFKAKWASNNDILIAGWESVEDKIKPTIWKITPFTNTQTFSYADTIRFSTALIKEPLPLEK